MLPDPPSDLRTVPRFDAFLDALSTDQPTESLTSDLDPKLVETTRRVHAGSLAPAPNPTFARDLRRTFLQTPTQVEQRSHRDSGIGLALSAPISSWKRRRWLSRLELASMIAIVAVLLVAVTTQGQWFNQQEARTPIPQIIGLAGSNTSIALQVSTDPTTPTSTATVAPSVPTISPNENARFSNGMIVVTTSDVRMRAEPSTGSDIVAEYAAGTKLVILSGLVEDEGYIWWQVRDNASGNEGWIAEDWLGPVGDMQASSPTAQPTMTAMNAPMTQTPNPDALWVVGAILGTSEPGLNLRQSPSFTAPIMTTLPIQTPVTLVGEPMMVEGLEWVQITVDASGETGYVIQDNLKSRDDRSTKPDLGNGLKVRTIRSSALYERPDPLSPLVAIVPESIVLSTTGRSIWDGDGRWWPVRVLSNGPSGYMLESFLEPAGPNQVNQQPTVTINTASTPTLSPSSTRFAVGSTVYVASNHVVMREDPAFDTTEVATLDQGTPLSTLGESVTTQGVVWWPVGDVTTGLTGYVVEAGLTDTLATPTPEPQAGFVDTDSLTEIAITVDADGLLAGDTESKNNAIAALRDALAPYATCRVGLVQTFGYSDDIAEGVRIANTVNTLLQAEFTDIFEHAVLDSFANVGIARGQVEIDLYFYQGCARFKSVTSTATPANTDPTTSPRPVVPTPPSPVTATQFSAPREDIAVGEIRAETPTSTPSASQ